MTVSETCIGGAVRVDVGVVESVKVGGAEQRICPLLHDFSPILALKVYWDSISGAFNVGGNDKQIIVLTPKKTTQG